MHKIVERKYLEEALQRVCKELAVLPQEVIEAAYAYRDFLVKHFPHNFKNTIHLGVYESYGVYSSGGIDRKFEVTVEVETRSVYHNDTETTRTISIKETNSLFPANSLRHNFPWHR